MEPPAQDSTAERLVAALLMVCFALLGWFDLWQGGITLKGKSGATSFVGGRAGLAVAGIAFLVATFGLALLLRSFKAKHGTRLAAGAALLVPPVVYALFHP